MSTAEDIKHQLNLLEINRRNLQLYLSQLTLHSKGFVPPGIISGIREARNNIVRIKNTLSEYYNIAVNDVPGVDFDVEETITLTISRGLYERIKDIVAEYDIEI